MIQGKSQKKSGLNIIIVGCGKVGMTLTRELVREGHDITIIDKNPQKIQSVTSLYDVMGLVGNGASYSIQMEAGIKNADLIVSVADSDELNILCCTIAKQVGHCATIARVRNPDYSKEVGYLQEKLGLTMIINPELETATEAARVLYLPTALEVNSFSHGQADMTKIKIPEGNPLDGMEIAALNTYLSNKGKTVNFLICAVEREGQVHIPSGNFVMQKGDIVSYVASRKTAKTFMESIGFKTSRVKNCLIVGGGEVAYYLAKQLLHMGISVKIIESNNARCEELSILLPKAVIINGDGTNEETLREEGLDYVDSFVALTGIDEENILLTLHAQQVSGAKVITKIDRSNFKNVINKLDMGSVVYPSNITSEAIIAYVRAKKNSADSNNIETLYHMFDYRAEAIEFVVDEKSRLTGVPLMELKLKNDVLVAFINRNGNIILPSGKDCIEVGDKAMIVTTHTGFKNIVDILA